MASLCLSLSWPLSVSLMASSPLSPVSSVKSILVNIFGGIMKCDVIARGILAAYEEVGLNIPLVVRLEGTNVEEGLALLQQSGLPIITARGLGEVSAVNRSLLPLLILIRLLVSRRLPRNPSPPSKPKAYS
jgi:hypothetical protein